MIIALILTTLLTLKPSYTKEEIRMEHSKIVRENSLEPGKDFGRFKLDTTTPGLLNRFAKENQLLIEYLLMNYDQVVYEYRKRMKQFGQEVEECCDSSQYSFIMSERLLPLISNYLNKHGSKIEAYEPWTKPNITLDRLAGNAAKFFFPDTIQPNGGVGAHICIALNGFQDLVDVRSAMMEAFCWSVVQPQVMGGQSALLDEFNRALDLAKELQLSSDPRTKLKRYQGVVWAYMSQSKVLRDLLLVEYEKKKHLLTFTLKSE